MKAGVNHLGPMIYVNEILYMKSWVNHLWLGVCVYIQFCDDMIMFDEERRKDDSKRGELRSVMTDDD